MNLKAAQTVWVEIPLSVDYDYSPGRIAIWYGDSPQPAELADLQVTAAMLGDLDIISRLSPGSIEDIEQQCWDHVRMVNEE